MRRITELKWQRTRRVVFLMMTASTRWRMAIWLLTTDGWLVTVLLLMMKFLALMKSAELWLTIRSPNWMGFLSLEIPCRCEPDQGEDGNLTSKKQSNLSSQSHQVGVRTLITERPVFLTPLLNWSRYILVWNKYRFSNLMRNYRESTQLCSGSSWDVTDIKATTHIWDDKTTNAAFYKPLGHSFGEYSF